MSSLLANLHTFGHSIWLPRLVSLALAGLMLWWLAITVLPMFEPHAPVATGKPKPVSVAKLAVRTDVTNLNLFGVAARVQPGSKAAEAKATKLKLTLRGILATGDPKVGLAQIEQEKDERYFSVGDSVFGHATLEEIYIDRVILLRDGTYETLLLPEEFLNNKHFEAAHLKQLRKKVATEYRDIILSRDSMALIKLFGFKTKFRNGSFLGFVVTALGDKGREMMKTLGVEEGDVIVAVNGLRFSESLEASAQLKDLKDATEVDVIIDRNGEEFPYHLEFDRRIEELVEIPEGMTMEEYEDQQVLAEPDYGESAEDQEYISKQRARKTGQKTAVEFDH